MNATNKQLTILSELEKAAFYDLPVFNYEQRLQYFSLTDLELELALTRQNLSSQIYCILQIGYFKAVKRFFRITWKTIDQEDCTFIMQQYFPHQYLEQNKISNYEHYTQCLLIADLFEYKLWNQSYTKQLYVHANTILTRDINPQFIAIELLSFLKIQKIIRPGYTTLQTIVSDVVNTERKRLSNIMKTSLSAKDKKLLETLLVEEDSLSKLAAIKQDAKDFKLHIIIQECQKMAILKPIYQVIKGLLPKLKLSQQNMHYYANLVNYYSIYDLRERLKIEQVHLYLLCYSWKRYQQFSDNLISAFSHNFKQIEQKVKESTEIRLTEYLLSQHDKSTKMEQLARLYIDDKLPDTMQFGTVREKAFTIVPKEELLKKLSNTLEANPKLKFHWESVDKFKRRTTLNLRYLIKAISFFSTNKNPSWTVGIEWIKKDLLKSKNLPLDLANIPNKLQQYLTYKNTKGKTHLNVSRYEYWIYRKVYNSIKTGSLYSEDSLQYKSLKEELVTVEDKDNIIKDLNIPALEKPIKEQLHNLFTELDQLWNVFNDKLSKGKLKHLHYDQKNGTLHSKKSKIDKNKIIEQHFYKQLPFCDIIDVMKFVNKKTNFLSTLTHIQPRYSKQSANEDHLIATIIAQAMNNGNLNMSNIANIPYSILQDTLQSRIRLNTLKNASNLISNKISEMSIFPFYSFEFGVLYAGVDGQKFEAATPTIKSKHSKKYFKKGKGIVAYTLLSNHIPLQTQLISPNEHESYFAFDIWHNNRTDICPDIITGDMHIINKANFAIMHWFGANLYPRFTNIEKERKHLYCSPNNIEYDRYLIQPVDKIDRELIESEWPNQQRIIATLELKEITQSTLIKKLCTYKEEHRTRKALFEYDKLIRSIHTLKCLINPNIQRNTHRSQNRIESYHQLRAAISQAYGKKELIGQTDIALENSNQCGRLIANAIIYYNSAILSKLKDKYEKENNQKGLKLLKKISPVAWQHTHFHGYLIFSKEDKINLDEIVSKLILID